MWSFLFLSSSAIDSFVAYLIKSLSSAKTKFLSSQRQRVPGWSNRVWDSRTKLTCMVQNMGRFTKSGIPFQIKMFTKFLNTSFISRRKESIMLVMSKFLIVFQNVSQKTFGRKLSIVIKAPDSYLH